MNFEFEMKLKSGPKLYIEGYAVIDYNCDCCGIDHISRVDYDQIVEMSTNLDHEPTELDLVQIEDMADRHVYDLLEEEREAV